jgi:hypothetical protein
MNLYNGKCESIEKYFNMASLINLRGAIFNASFVDINRMDSISEKRYALIEKRNRKNS